MKLASADFATLHSLLMKLASSLINIFISKMSIKIFIVCLILIDQPKLIPKFDLRPEPTRPDPTRPYTNPISQLKHVRIQPKLKLKLS